MKARSKIRTKSLHFRALFDAIGDIFVVASPDGKIIFGNAALERKLGYTPGDLAAMHVLDLNPADKRQEAEDIFAAMFRGERDSCPLPLAAKNKTLLPADTRVWFGKWNGADCLFGISKDLSAEQEAQQRFERLFRHNPTLMAVSSIPERRFTDVNNILLSTLGYSAEEIIGKTSAEIGLFLNPQLQAAAADRLQSNGTFNELELQIRCKDGKILDGLFSGEIIYSQGKECFLTVMLDISERKRMVEGLRRSEQGFATLVKNLPDMIVRFSTSLEIILCNQALEAELGKPVDTFIGKKLLEIGIPVEQSTLLIDSLEQALDTGEEVDVEQSYLTSSGLKHYLARIVPERNSEGKIETLLAIIHDITGRKMIENEQERFNAEMERQVNDRTAQLANAQYRLEDKISELEQAQESLKDLSTKNRIVAENTHDWEFWRDGNGMFIYTSPSCSRITGYEAEEFLRDPRFMEKIIHPHDLSIWQNHTEETAFIKQPGQVEFRILRADGSVCWIDHVCQPVFDDQGRYSGERGSNRDISRSKREQWKKETAIEALSKSEKRLCKLVESVTNYIYTVKVEGGRPLSTSHGDGCESVMGYTPKEFASDPDLWLRVVHPEDSVLVTQQAAKIISGTAVLPIEHRIIRKDGSIRWIKNTHVAQFNKQGKLEGYDGLIVDITERKQAEEDIRNQAARAEVLLHTAASLNTQLDLVTLMNTVCEETASAFKAPSVWIDLYDPKRDTLNFASACNLPPEFKERYQPPSRAMHQLATQLKPMIIIPDVQNVDHANRKLFTSLNIRTVTNMSMMRDGQLIGILNVISYGSVRHFSPNELALLKGISDQAAQSIENARLFKDAQRHLNLQRALHLIDLTITSETQLNASLKIILQLIAGQLNVDSALVLLVDPQSGALDDIASYGLLENMPKLHLEKGENYASRILLNRSPIHIPDLAQAENWVSPALLDLKKGVCYYGTPLIVQDKVIGILEFINTSPFNLDAEWIETLEALATQTAIAIGSVTLLCDLKQSNADLSQAYDTTLEGWSHAMDLRDKETEGHTQRVTAISVRLAGAMGLGEAELLNIRRGALLHDMGKMGIPDSILLKPGPLTDEEWVIMRKHPMYAYEMLSPIGYLRPALDIAYCHHEKWDGSGYPRGLKGDEIPLAARIFAIADVWDALTSDRPYRSAWSPEKTSQHIQEQSGSHFDPQVTAIFVKMLDELLDK